MIDNAFSLEMVNNRGLLCMGISGDEEQMMNMRFTDMAPYFRQNRCPEMHKNVYSPINTMNHGYPAASTAETALSTPSVRDFRQWQDLMGRITRRIDSSPALS
jgi:hypothetical protein